MKTLDDVKALLMKDADGTELYEVVSNAIHQERERGKGLVKAVQQKLEVVDSVLKELGFNPVTNDLSTFQTDLKGKLANGEKNGKELTGKDARLQNLETSLTNLTNQLTTSNEKATKFEKSYKHGILKEALNSKLGGKIFSADIHAKDIIREGSVVLEEDNKTVKWKDGDELKDLDVGIKAYLDSHPDDVINDQRPGPGGKPGGKPKAGKTMSKGEFNSLRPDARMEIIKKGEVQVVD